MKNVYIAIVVFIVVFSFGQYSNAYDECRDINDNTLEILNEYYHSDYVSYKNRKYMEWTYVDENVIEHTILIEIE